MTTKMIGLILVFVVIGTPMVYVLWSFVNDLLTGHFDPGSAMVAVPVLVVFAVLLVFLGRWARRQAE